MTKLLSSLSISSQAYKVEALAKTWNYKYLPTGDWQYPYADLYMNCSFKYQGPRL